MTQILAIKMGLGLTEWDEELPWMSIVPDIIPLRDLVRPRKSKYSPRKAS